jgi:hypothetical protein
MRMKLQSGDTLDGSVELFKAFVDPVRLRLLNLARSSGAWTFAIRPA